MPAHYDTPLREPLPAILCPTRPVTYMLYQALTPVLALVLCFAVSLGVTFALSLPNLTLPLFLVLLIGALAYLKYGRRRRTMSTPTPPAWRRCSAPPSSSRRATATTSASSFWTAAATICGRQGIPQALSERQGEAALCLDCVGSGDELLILPGKGAR